MQMSAKEGNKTNESVNDNIKNKKKKDKKFLAPGGKCCKIKYW